MEDMPKLFEDELLNADDVEVSDWVQNALDSAKRLEVAPHERSLADKLIEQALRHALNERRPIGTVLAAAFDLLIAAEYYKSVSHQGWYYCPIHKPALFYPFTNTCPRCILEGGFHFERANKPESGSIGKATSRLLSVFLNQLFKRENRGLTIYQGSEPIDMLIHDATNSVVLLAEIKAAPLTTLALVVTTDAMTEPVEGEQPILITKHISTDNTSLSSNELNIFLPIRRESNNAYRFVSLGKVSLREDNWGYKRIEQLLDQDTEFFSDYLNFWIEAYEVYKDHYRAARNTSLSNTFWFTNACGQPNPRPTDWPPRRAGGGFESVSDGKTSVGMDRTDDIKKGIYQVLKVGAESKPNAKRFQVKTALISNIHAVRHYQNYLLSLEDIVWLIDKEKKARKAGELPSDADVYNLFDGIISFTESHIRDEWIERTFIFRLETV